jgi:hypothetical protein
LETCFAAVISAIRLAWVPLPDPVGPDKYLLNTSYKRRTLILRLSHVGPIHYALLEGCHETGHLGKVYVQQVRRIDALSAITRPFDQKCLFAGLQ